MFSLHDFVMATLRGMVGKEPEYKVRQYALGWYDRGELSSEDMSELDARLSPAASAAEDAEDEEEAAGVTP